MPEKKTQQEAGTSANMEALLERINELEKQLELVRYASESIEKKKKNDPSEMWRTASERVAKNRELGPGKYTWKVTIPGFLMPVLFRSDTDNEQAAIREFETRFGTRFVTNSQREDGNHKIELVERSYSA